MLQDRQGSVRSNRPSEGDKAALVGHPVGAALLTEVGYRLHAAVRSDDVVGRLGGDEFLIVLFRNLSDAKTTDLADRIIDALEEPFQIADNDVYVSASIGVTLFCPPLPLEALEQELASAGPPRITR